MEKKPVQNLCAKWLIYVQRLFYVQSHIEEMCYITLGMAKFLARVKWIDPQKLKERQHD